MLTLSLVALLSPLYGADPEFFETKIRPVLAKNCYACHSSAAKQPLGGVRVDKRETVIGSLVVPGKPEDSRLYRSLTYMHPIKMPPSGKLPDETLRDFRTWIESGAEFPESQAAKQERFWAFEPVRKVNLPDVRQVDWIRTPVDAFILKRLEDKKTNLAPGLGKRALLRRLSFDLTGLPPTLAELNEFLRDESPQAYDKAVERLLGSPHYGERWARHWLDLMRYAETNGHEYDNDKLTPWRYRDYVIRAFNSDLPYDQFVREHIAGDILPRQRLSKDGAALESPLATAFYFFGEVLNSSTDPAKTRADEVDNQIDVIGKAFQGLTIACARCHDHKFDPIPTAEYYALAGILHSTEYREAAIDSPGRSREILKARHGGALVAPPAEISHRPEDSVYADFSGRNFGTWSASGAAFGDSPILGTASSLAAGAPEFMGTLTSPAFTLSDKRYLHVRLSGTPSDKKLNERGPLRITLVCGGYKARSLVPEGHEPKWTTIGLVLERNRKCYIEFIDHSADGYLSVDELVFSDLADPPPTSPSAAPQGPLRSVRIPPTPFTVVASEGTPRDTPIHIRGSHTQLGEVSPRRHLSILAGSDQAPIRSGSGRLELAERIASPRNPLTARVMVNRIWKHHFGEGIVRSTDNFGVMGERPQDLALLDYLASVFVESGWSVKSIHRLIVQSEWYRSSAHKPHRLEAEAVRDNILAVSGALKRELYGPSVPPYIGKYQNGRGRPASGPLDSDNRRSIYIQVRRNFIPPLFVAFDYPAPASTIGARGASAVPSQALLLLNNEFVQEQARLFARSILASSNPDRIGAMYERAFARPADGAERQRIDAFIAKQSERSEEDIYTDLAHVLFNSPEFIYVP